MSLEALEALFRERQCTPHYLYELNREPERWEEVQQEGQGVV